MLLSSTKLFGQMPIDQCAEVTVNNDTQTPGGTNTFNLKAGAIQHYYFTAEYTCIFTGQLRDMVHSDIPSQSHTDQ